MSCGCTKNGDISPWDGEHWDSISNFPGRFATATWKPMMAIGGFVFFLMKQVINLIWNRTCDISFNRKCLFSRNIIAGYPNPFVNFPRCRRRLPLQWQGNLRTVRSAPNEVGIMKCRSVEQIKNTVYKSKGCDIGGAKLRSYRGDLFPYSLGNDLEHQKLPNHRVSNCMAISEGSSAS